MLRFKHHVEYWKYYFVLFLLMFVRILLFCCEEYEKDEKSKIWHHPLKKKKATAPPPHQNNEQSVCGIFNMYPMRCDLNLWNTLNIMFLLFVERSWASTPRKEATQTQMNS